MKNVAREDTDHGDEEWRPVRGYEGFYEVSNHGRVRSLDRIIYRRDGVVTRWPGKIMALTRNADGYPTVMLNPGRKRITSHRLVAQAFLGSPPDGQEANHRDGDKTNGHVANLEWVTHQENMMHANSTGLRQFRGYPGESCPTSKLTEEDVRAIRELAGHLTQQAIAARFGVSRSNVAHIVARKTWTHI